MKEDPSVVGLLVPLLHGLRAMATDVVQYYVELGAPVAAQQLAHEADELFGPVPFLNAGNNAAGVNIKGSVGLDGPISFVVVGAPLYLAGPHGQKGLGPIQCLDLGLLVHTQNQGVLRWIQIRTHHIYQLGYKVRIRRAREGAHPTEA